MIMSLLSLSKVFLASLTVEHEPLSNIDVCKKLQEQGFNEQQIKAWFKLIKADRKQTLGLPLTKSEQDILDKEDGKIKA